MEIHSRFKIQLSPESILDMLCISFLVAKRLSYPFIVGSQFFNLHMEAISIIRVVLQFHQGYLPITRDRTADKPCNDVEIAQ